MWKSSLIFSIILVASLFAFAQGLECYQCAYDSSLTLNELERQGFYGIQGHSSCKKGQVPDKKLKVKCDSADGGKSNPVCLQLSLDNVPGRNRTGSNTLNIRGCYNQLPYIGDLKKGKVCSSRTYGNVTGSAAGGKMQSALTASVWYIGTEKWSSFCHCDSNNCNPASKFGVSGGGKAISLLMTTVMVAFTSSFH